MRLCNQLPDGVGCPSMCASQHFLQHEMELDLLSSLTQTATLRGKAQLNTIARNHAGTWLWAIPNFHLSFAMSPHEFVLAVRLRVGAPLFPFPL